jgi:hypothetical protein
MTVAAGSGEVGLGEFGLGEAGVIRVAIPPAGIGHGERRAT